MCSIINRSQICIVVFNVNNADLRLNAQTMCVNGFLQNLRNEEQVAIIQASTVLSLAEKVHCFLRLYIREIF